MACSLPAVNRERVDTASVSSLLSLLSFQMGTNTILDNSPSYSVLGFREQNLHLPSKEKRFGSLQYRPPSCKFQVS